MSDAVLAATIVSVGGIVTGFFAWLAARRANRNTSEANVQKWANDLLAKLQQAQQDMDRIRGEGIATVQRMQQEVDDLREQVHKMADELRACQEENRDIRRQAMREDDMYRFREWLYDPQRRAG